MASILSRFHYLLILLLLGSVISPPLSADEFEDGRAAYQAGEYDKALKILRPLAEQGNSQAQVTLGIMYDYGQGVETDPAEAMKWYIKAAEQGIPVVQHDVGVKYFQGMGVEQDYLEAAKWWELSASSGLADSQFNLGLLYYRGLGVEQDYKKAAELFSLAAEQDHSHAQYSLAVMNAFGHGMNKDYQEALKWFRKSADQGVAQAQFNLGVFYENGYGVDKDMDEARSWYQKAAELELPEAQKKLAELDEKGSQPVPDKNAAPAEKKSKPEPIPDVQSGIAENASHGIKREAWVYDQAADSYTLQLSSVLDENSALKFIHTYGLEDTAAYFRVKVKGTIRYTVITGVYASHDQASAAIKSLPDDLQKNKPWVRNFGLLQKLIAESQ